MFMSGRAFGPSQRRTLGLGWAVTSKVVESISGRDPDELQAIFRKHSDIGDWAGEALEGRTQPEPVSLAEVETTLEGIRTARGGAKLQDLVNALDHVRIYHGSFFPRITGQVLPNWMQLTESVRTGQPVKSVSEQDAGAEFFADLVEGIFRLLFTDFHEPVNLGNPNEVSILDFAKEILELSGSKSEIVFKPLPQDDPKVRQPDITRARQLLGWEPTVDRHDGLKRTLAYFRRQVAMPKSD